MNKIFVQRKVWRLEILNDIKRLNYTSRIFLEDMHYNLLINISLVNEIVYNFLDFLFYCLRYERVDGLIYQIAFRFDIFLLWWKCSLDALINYSDWNELRAALRLCDYIWWCNLIIWSICWTPFSWSSFLSYISLIMLVRSVILYQKLLFF